MNRLILLLLFRLPQGALSRLTGWLAHRPVPRPFRSLIIGGFARVVGIRTDEALQPPSEFASIGAYFVRHLRPGVRSWPADEAVPASPVDGIVGACGDITEGKLLQAKGMAYSLRELVGDPEEAKRYEDGVFITLYLSPRHYHRIHTPMAGELTLARSIPGRLLPVHRAAVRQVKDLFPRNERLVVHVDGDVGCPMALVAVGAFNVGKISAAFEPGWTTNRPDRTEGDAHEVRTYRKPVRRGEELAAFHLGSTVVLLFGPEIRQNGWALHPERTQHSDVLLGDPLFFREPVAREPDR